MTEFFKIFGNRQCFLSIGFWMGISGSIFAAEDAIFSGKFSPEIGTYQSPNDSLRVYSYGHLLLQSQYDLSDSLSWNLACEFNWQSPGSAVAAVWPLYPVKNILDLEIENIGDLNRANTESLRMSRASLKWASGRMEATAGLQSFNWGSAHFFQPTHFFFPLGPLDWTRDQPLGSEGLDANCFLFDDLSLEGTARWLDGGADEWVVRLIDKNVGFAVVPSFARLTGRDGLGLELSVTFPDFKVWAEGVDWLYPSMGSGQAPPAQLEWVVGASAIVEETTFVLEAYRDGTGSVLGGFSNGTADGTYLFASAEKPFPGEWKATLGFVKALEGGPLLFWPKLSCQKMELQGQIPIGNGSGPLAAGSSRVGISVSYPL